MCYYNITYVQMHKSGGMNMISQTLREARIYEDVVEKTISEEERPSFHLSARVGWMNDPNGFCFYKGKYHMFYQYYPYEPKWGPMHWGHAVSTDLLHWEYMPAALAPDQIYDQDGCFSGSAVELPDGRLMLLYTGVRLEGKRSWFNREVQVQCIAVGDGENFEKYEHNPVLTDADVPEGSSKYDFRDPKVWKCEDGTYRCLVGNRPSDGSGQLLLYTSKNGFDWKFLSVFAANQNRFGKMWECPDYFCLDGKHVILTSPQDMFPQGFEYHNGNGTLCLIGEYDAKTESFREESDQSIDYGIDFYAPQTILAPDGRRIMIGWMQNWDTCEVRSPYQKWQGQMTLPRELSIKNGRLYQAPLKELENLRANKVAYINEEIDGERTFPGISGRKVDMEICIRPQDPEDLYHKFSVHFAMNKDYHISVNYRPHENVLKIDRKFSGSRRAFIHQRRSKVIGSENGELRLRLILDRYSVEVFVNDGAQVITATYYTPLDADGIMFVSSGKVRMDVIKYDLI